MKSKYYTWETNIDGALRNGSYVAQRTQKRFVQFFNGDYIGEIAKVPAGMCEVNSATAKLFLPKGYK